MTSLAHSRNSSSWSQTGLTLCSKSSWIDFQNRFFSSSSVPQNSISSALISNRCGALPPTYPSSASHVTSKSSWFLLILPSMLLVPGLVSRFDHQPVRRCIVGSNPISQPGCRVFELPVRRYRPQREQNLRHFV